MASRYLNNNSWSYTALTRTLNVTLSPSGFTADDATYHRTIFFVDTDDSVYWGCILTYVNSAEVILDTIGNLPVENLSPEGVCAILYDFGTRRTYGSYITAIDTLVKDEAVKLSASDKVQALNSALVDYGKDRPYKVSKFVTHNDTPDYLLTTVLGSLWNNEFSVIEEIEYPAGQSSPQMLDNDDYTIYDDGTAQDGSNLILKFAEDLSEDFIVKFTTERKIPVDTVPNFPDTNDTFNNLILLGAMYECLMLASAFAQSIDSSISADAVNYNEKTNKYISLAKTYYKRYCLNVFGAEEPTDNVKSGVVSHNIDVQSSMNTPSLFHSRKGL
jgi:hypothetical protein